MSFLDFSPLRQSTGFATALEPLAATINDWADQRAKRRHERDMQARRLAGEHALQSSKFAYDSDAKARAASEHAQDQANELAYKRETQNRLSNEFNKREERMAGADDRAEKRLVGQMAVANNQNRQKFIEGLRGKVRNQDLAGAESDVAGYQEVDPETGKVLRGKDAIAFNAERPDIGPPPTQPDYENEMPAEPDYSDYHEQADSIAANKKAADEAAARNMRLRSEFQGSEEAYRQKAADSALDTEVAIGGGPPQTIRQMRYGGAAQDAKDFGGYIAALEAGQPTPKLDQAKRLAAAVESGQLPARTAIDMVEKGVGAGEQRDFTAGQNDANRANALERQRIANQRPQRGASPTADGNLQIRTRDAFEKRVSDMAKRHGVPEDTKNYMRSNNAILGAESDNGVLQAAAQFGAARDITGGGGMSLSNKDVAMVAPRAGGLERLQAMAQRLINGENLSPGEQKVLADALRAGARGAVERIKTFEDDYNAAFGGDDLPWRRELGDNYVKGTLRQYVPQTVTQSRSQPAGPAPAAKRKGAANMPVEAGGLVGTAAKPAQETPQQREERLAQRARELGLLD